jgi:hypothetical protein
MIDKKLKTIIPDTDFFFIFPVVNPITFRNEKKIIFFFRPAFTFSAFQHSIVFNYNF